MTFIHFWEAWLIISGAAFALITIVVTVKGFADLSFMFQELRKQQHQ
jgi:hypothetical protein